VSEANLIDRIVMPVVDLNMLRAYKKKFNFFETPEVLADQMAGFLDGLGRNARILEPSAGMGALIRAIERAMLFLPQIDYCEIQEEFAAILSTYNRVGSDFMQYKPGPVYDAVIINPPYKNKLAELHVDHAWNCIKPGGWIVALVGKTAGSYIGSEYEGHIFHEEMIKKGFQETAVDTCLFLINKPLWA
jgi:16S rRNA G966 N2-methylase RsmD